MAVRRWFRTRSVRVRGVLSIVPRAWNPGGWWHGCGTLFWPVSTDAKATKILARTFFNQLRSSGYTPTQVIAVATELIDLVATGIREADKTPAASPVDPEESRPAA